MLMMHYSDTCGVICLPVSSESCLEVVVVGVKLNHRDKSGAKCCRHSGIGIAYPADYS
jgi:hypothetical protein